MTTDAPKRDSRETRVHPLPDRVAQPPDKLNGEWLSHVQPADYRNPSPKECYDMLVIGAGSAGKTVAKRAADMGKATALVENRAIGGVCNNFGCIPSKALLRCGRVIAEVRGADRFGIRIDGAIEADFPAIMKRMRRLRAETGPGNSPSALTDKGIDLFMGDGRFISEDAFEVNGLTLKFHRACIATGTGPRPLPLPDGDRMVGLTNETLFSLTELPKRLAVIGGGPIGCEMAEAFARFGSEVKLIEVTGQILPRDDPEAAAIVRASLEKSGVDVVCQCKVTSIRQGHGRYVLDLGAGEDGAPLQQIQVDEVLLALGRVPLIDGLNLEAAGVEADEQGIVVNNGLETGTKNIYAAGDVCSAYRFTHAANAMGEIVVENALRGGLACLDDLVIPWCTYTDPELAQVGLTPQQAEQQEVPIDTYKVPLNKVARDWIDGRDEGFLKVHCRKGDDRIVGATMVSRQAGDIIAQIAQAMTLKIGLRALAPVIFPFPTHAEVIKILATQAASGE